MLLEKRTVYKPLLYPWAMEAFDTHERLHWLASEVSLNSDVIDWKTKLSSGQRNFLENLFRFFTQADVSVASAYATKYLPLFAGNPEVAMMLASFAAREGVHVRAYSLLIDTLGLPESEYSAFLEYGAMRDKYEFLEKVDTSTELDIAKAVAIYSAFTEGMQLYASFAMLMHFERIGKMSGMTNIVRWSMKDEMTHADNMIRLFHTFQQEYLNDTDKDCLQPQIRSVAEKMVELEDKFIELAFSVASEAELNVGLPSHEVPLTEKLLKQYIRHIADYRLTQLGYEPLYGIVSNPLKWLDVLMVGSEHTNFFEARPTQYAKGAVQHSKDEDIQW